MKKIGFKNWILIGISVSLLLVFLVGYSSYRSLQNVSEDQAWVDHTEKLISKCDAILKLVIDAEGSQRGYLLTTKEEFLKPYENASEKIDVLLKEIEKLIFENPVQFKNTQKLKILVQQRFNRISNIIKSKKTKNISSSKLINELILGKRQMDTLRSHIRKMIDAERVLLVKRTNSTEKSLHKAILTIFGGTFLIFVIILILFKFIRNSFANQIKAQNELSVTNIDLERFAKQNETRNWILQGTQTVSDGIRGEINVDTMAQKIIDSVADYTKAKVGAIYLLNENSGSKPTLSLKAGYAFPTAHKLKQAFYLNETWVGQVAAGKRPQTIKGKISDDIKISSGLLTAEVFENILMPFYVEDKLKGIIELGFDDHVTEKRNAFLTEVAGLIAVGINRSQARERLEYLLQQTQAQAEELETQQEELRVTNEELTSKTEMLQASEEELRVQQEELQETNAALVEKAKLLSEKNLVIEEARAAVLLKMEELEISGRYKSEFLANMSHELRTPLNSILILARILKDNKTQNLSAEEQKYADVIFKAGNDLLQLINDILDLAKIESGKIDLVYEHTKIEEIAEDLKMLFTEVAKSKSIDYKFTFADDLPKTVEIDRFRTEQILNNLLSNAFKFTPDNGKIEVTFSLHNSEHLKIEVCDSGIGIPEEKQKLIFEAFQQADGSTSREFGGTGLGLSISTELAKYMVGHITVSSIVKVGSKFSLIIPIKQPQVHKTQTEQTHAVEDVKHFSPQITTNNEAFTLTKSKNERATPILLVVEDDPVFSDFLKDYGKSKGFEVAQIYNGELVFQNAVDLQPDAILLDVMLPGIDGWKVLKKLKSEPKTAHIRVHMMSASDQRVTKALQSGALSFIKKPVELNALDDIFNQIVSTSVPIYQNILLVEDHQVQSDALAQMFRDRHIHVTQAYTGAETLILLKQQYFDCLILDLNLPDVSGLDLLEQIKETESYKDLPVIINTAMELDQEKMKRLLKYSDATVMKSTKSSDRILDEVNLFLHQIKLKEGKGKNKISTNTIEALKDKSILLVDDDMRNIFALSTVLDGFGFTVEIANDGEEALQKLEKMEKVDLVLMDIMMPKMNGYETMIAIRNKPRWKKLPIIALTAKAMKEDREKCIDAGANEYITKPIDIDKLMSLIKVWLAI